MTTRRWIGPAAALFCGLLCVGVSAQGASQGRGRGNGGGAEPGASVTVVFRESDRATFHDYFVTHKIVAQSLPPGIAQARGAVRTQFPVPSSPVLQFPSS